MPPARIAASDREFLADVARVVYGNPFSAARAALIVRLAPGAIPGDLTTDPQALYRVVWPRVEPLVRAGTAAIAALSEEDRRLVEPAFLYVCFHRAVLQLDALIRKQAAQGGEPLPVTFSEAVIGDFMRCGFSEERARRYVSLIFQLRRGFLFIEGDLRGACDSMRRLREALWNNIFTHDMRGFEAALWNRMEDFSTLLLGETGTGKGNVARAIGRSVFIPYDPARGRFAANFTETFIAINLSQFPESLIESELFGHRKGAFTGAIEHHDGVFARCNEHGALFLDEIGEVSTPVQIKLLQVLQERTFVPVGGRDKKRFGGRVIAATNQPLGALRRDGRFRNDFFYRLSSDVIEVPTLRQRLAESPAELELLVRLLVSRIAGAEVPELVTRVLEALEANLPRGYPWPGNVRELEQAVRRILLTGRYAGEVAPSAGSEDDALADRLRAGDLTAEELLARYCALLYARLGSYAEVAKRTGLDPRTARKYVDKKTR
jgi:transcriptional regulator with AAA-type ATPase domain